MFRLTCAASAQGLRAGNGHARAGGSPPFIEALVLLRGSKSTSSLTHGGSSSPWLSGPAMRLSPDSTAWLVGLVAPISVGRLNSESLESLESGPLKASCGPLLSWLRSW